MQFVLASGLQIKRGEQILQLVRELGDGQELQFEDVVTKRPTVLQRGDLIRKIHSDQIHVVWSDDAQVDSGGSSLLSTSDLSTLPQKQREQIELRLGFVRALLRHRVSRGQRHKVAQVIAKHAAVVGLKELPSASAVMEWSRRFQTSSNNPLSLLSKNGTRKTKKRVLQAVEELIWQSLKKHYFNKEHHSAKYAFEQLKIEFNKAVKAGKIDHAEANVTYPTLCRRINEVDLYHRVASRDGVARARMVCRTAFPGGVPTYPYQRVEIDHTPLNWVVLCERTGLPLGRPTLTTAIDGFSGYVLGLYLSFYGPGATSLSGVLRSALQPKDEVIKLLGLSNPWYGDGLPDDAWVDNGLEFHSYVFKMIAMSLGFDITYCRVRTPWLKPRVERFFGTLNTLTLAGGRVSKVVANVARIDPYKDAVITFCDLVAGLLKFVVDVHPWEPNWRKMATPMELFLEGMEHAPPAIFPGSLHQLKLASGMSKQLNFTQGGIELHGLPFGSYSFKDIARQWGTGFKLLCKVNVRPSHIDSR
jgi:putative transposase